MKPAERKIKMSKVFREYKVGEVVRIGSDTHWVEGIAVIISAEWEDDKRLRGVAKWARHRYQVQWLHGNYPDGEVADGDICSYRMCNFAGLAFE